MEKDKSSKDGIGRIDPFQPTSGFSISSTADAENQEAISISISGGNNSRKEISKAKRAVVRFHCSVYEKKLLQVRAKNSCLSVSEFCRRAVTEVEIKERLSEEHIKIYKAMVKSYNNFKTIENMLRKKDPKLASSVYQLVKDIKSHLENLKK